MARIQLSEYTAKRLLLGGDYPGRALKAGDHNARKELDAKNKYVLKVDQGVKKRHKQGLVAVGITPSSIETYLQRYAARGYQQFLLEPFMEHEADSERYLSVERVRGGLYVLYGKDGGVEVERAGDSVQRVLYAGKPAQLKPVVTAFGVTTTWLEQLLVRFDELHMSFLEINPLVVLDGKPLLLDCAAEVDSAAAYFTDEWSLDDNVASWTLSPAERAVAELAANSASSFSLKVVHADGGLGMLLSGGGASVAIADEVCNLGQADKLLNYGEYSGNPTREETSLYTSQVLKLLLDSKARRKALVIAGGVANFTDIKQTFVGVIEALEAHAAQLKRQKVKVFVRRGGPNEQEGLAMMSAFLQKHSLYGCVDGSESALTSAAAAAVEYVK
jgi:succinyl-CoA synthetase beta subunit